MSSHPIQLEGDNQAGDLSPKVARFGLGLAVVGLGLGAALGFMSNDHDAYSHFWFAYLVAFCFVFTIVLGATFFTIVQHLVNAHWSVSVRRLSELTMANIPLFAIFALPLLVPAFSDDVEVWKWASMGHGHEAAADHGATDAAGDQAHAGPAEAHDLATQLEHEEHEHFVAAKEPYLNRTFFIIRLIAYFLLWMWMARFFFKKSVDQDTAEGIAPTLGAKKVSAVSVILFAFALSFFSFDVLMSLDETWFSTIFGVYIFAGAFLSCVCWMVLMSKFLQAKGKMTKVINDEHYHDLGKWMFAFTFFWGYIAFSQFMLIWYANIPEETHFYAARLTDAWTGWTWCLLIFHFIIPFAGLLSRHVKRNTNVLKYWAIYMLVLHWVDIYWIAMPNYKRGEAGAGNPFGLMEIALAVGMIGVLIYGIGKKSAKQALLPVRDPLLGKCLGFKNI
ncbi:MAG: hypothetical protein QF489_00630 [Planctomycetota bacterium]|jgi:hypothetical protein|nr:hypothetical protein [Planctomycetota bacterium]